MGIERDFGTHVRGEEIVSLNRYAKARDANERGIIEALEAQGCSVCQLDQPMDLLVGFEDKEGRRRTLIFEVKMPKGKTTEGQDEFQRTWKGDVVAVVRNVDEALTHIGCETRGVEIGPRVPAFMSSPWLDGRGSE